MLIQHKQFTHYFKQKKLICFPSLSKIDVHIKSISNIAACQPKPCTSCRTGLDLKWSKPWSRHSYSPYDLIKISRWFKCRNRLIIQNIYQLIFHNLIYKFEDGKQKLAIIFLYKKYEKNKNEILSKVLKWKLLKAWAKKTEVCLILDQYNVSVRDENKSLHGVWQTKT